MIVRMLFDMAMRVTEVSRVKIPDILRSDGTWRDGVLLPAKICKSGKAGIVYTFSPQFRKAGDAYFDLRIKKKQWLGDPNKYRGLHKESTVILSDRGCHYSLKRKPYTNVDGETKIYLAADTLQSVVSKWFDNAGIKGGSGHSGRRSYANRLAIKGVGVEHIAELLRHSDDRYHNVTYEYIDPDMRLLTRATKELFDV